MATCPSCGRYVGPTNLNACPHCGARLGARMTIRALQAGALGLAVLGLIWLWWFATHSPLPTLKIGQAQATMNFAYVRVQGQVTRAPSYDPDSGYLSFWIEDETGEMLVSAYRATTKQLVESGRMPFIGDHVSVEGSLRMRPDNVSLTLNSADGLRIERPQPVVMDIAQIDAACALRVVTVRGLVRAVRSPYTGLTLITLRDATGEIDVAAPDLLAAPDSLAAPEAPVVQVGQNASATGAVTLYKGTPQVTLARADALQVSPDAVLIASLTHIGQLAPERAGEWVAVQGTVVKVSPFSAGVKLTLDDGTGRTDLVLWQDVYGVLSPTLQLAEGAQISAQGELSLYRGATEVVPELPTDVMLVVAALTGPPAIAAVAPTFTATPYAPTRAPTPTSIPATPTRTPAPPRAIASVSLGQLAPADKGRLVAVRGRIVAVIPFSKGMKYRLDDGAGRVILLLWQEVLEQVPDRDKLVKGAQVSVVGAVDVYGGDIEVVPRWGRDVKVVQ